MWKYLAACLMVFFLVSCGPIKRFILLKHEMGHAKAAKKYGTEAVVVLKDAKNEKKEKVGSREGIKIYHITPERFRKYYGKNVNAVCIHNTKFGDENLLKIIKAGPISSSIWCCFFGLIWGIVLGIILYLILGEVFIKEFNKYIYAFFIMELTMGVIPWLFDKMEMENLKKQVRDIIKHNEKRDIQNIPSDGTRIICYKTFLKCLKEIDAHSELFTSYEEKLARFQDLDSNL